MLTKVINAIFGKKPTTQQELQCSVCENKPVSFAPLPDYYREHALRHGFEYFGMGETISLEMYSCNHCGASDRERIYSLWIDQQLEKNILDKNSRIIHFAPEAALSKRLKNLGFLKDRKSVV